MRKFMSVVLLMVIVLISTFAYGESSNKINNDVLLDEYELLTNDEIIKLAEYNLEQMFSEYTLDKKMNNWLELYDNQDNLIAYMIPFLDNRNIDQFITVSAIKSGYDFYSVSDNYQLYKNLANLKDIDKQKKKTKFKIILLPPNNYLIQSNTNEVIEFTEVIQGDSIENFIGDIVTSENVKNNSNLNGIYNKAKSKSNKEKIEHILLEGSILEFSSRISMYSSSSYGSAYLVNYPRYYFVPVTSGSMTHYGGSQYWWPSGYQSRSNGCGPVAAANILAYFANKNISKYGALYLALNMTKAEYLYHMDIVYDYIDPPWYGLLSENVFASDVVSLAATKGVSLTSHVAGAWTSFDDTVDFILTGLRSDSPVAVLNGSKTDPKPWHWMTITGLNVLSDTAGFVFVSNCGNKESINFIALDDAVSLNGGYVYFD